MENRKKLKTPLPSRNKRNQLLRPPNLHQPRSHRNGTLPLRNRNLRRAQNGRMRPLSPPGSRFPRSTTQSLVDVDCTRVVHVLYWSVYSRGTAGKGSTCSTGGLCGDCGDLFVCGVFSVWLGESLLFLFLFFWFRSCRDENVLGADTFSSSIRDRFAGFTSRRFLLLDCEHSTSPLQQRHNGCSISSWPEQLRR